MLSKQKLRIAALSTAVIAFAATGGTAFAQKKYDTGATVGDSHCDDCDRYCAPKLC